METGVKRYVFAEDFATPEPAPPPPPQFVSLPAALLACVEQVNNAGVPATVHTLRRHLHTAHPHIQPPNKVCSHVYTQYARRTL